MLMTLFIYISSRNLIQKLNQSGAWTSDTFATGVKLNQLALNTKKSHFMLVGSHARLSTIDSITIFADNKHLDEFSHFHTWN